MKIKKDELKSVAKILKSIKYDFYKGNGVVVLPIENDLTKSFEGGLELTSQTKTSRSELQPVLAFINEELGEDSKTGDNVVLGYADLSYATKFSLVYYANLLNVRLSKKDIETLNPLDCCVIQKDHLMLSFKI